LRFGICQLIDLADSTMSSGGLIVGWVKNLSHVAEELQPVASPLHRP
jgi:hypothetical protein